MIQYVADRQALYMQAKQTRSDILYMTTLDTGRCSQVASGSSGFRDSFMCVGDPFLTSGLEFSGLKIRQAVFMEG